MSELSSLLGPGEALLVLSSLNAQPQDRKLDRSEVRPVQVILDGEMRPVPFFDSWGDLGVSSLAWHPDRPETLYVATDDATDYESSTELWKVELLENREVIKLDAPPLRDVHEMAVIGDTLWISNTGRDEAVSLQIPYEKVSKIISLPLEYSDEASVDDAEGDVSVVEKFHCNQVFEGYEGDLYVLVHHVSGKQVLQRTASKLIKRQGNGGVINLSRKRSKSLGLSAPHSVRRVAGDYWILDSGHFTINVYGQDWSLEEELSLKGWGRGADTSASRGIFYVGTSEVRRRYKDRIRFAPRSSNTVCCIDLDTGKLVGEIPVPNVGEVNSVHVVRAEVARALLEL